MSIGTTYRELILEGILRDILEEGAVPSIAELDSRLAAYLDEHDPSEPLFDYTDYAVATNTSASVASTTGAYQGIYNDLRALYKHLLATTDLQFTTFDRWKAEARLLEAQLVELEGRIDTLLLLSRDTTGYLNYVQDYFTDLSKVDLANTTAHCDAARRSISIGSTAGATESTRIDLSGIKDSDIEFNILTKNNLAASALSQGSRLRYAVSDIENYWLTRVIVNKPSPVTTELKVKLGDAAVSISRIEVDLHMANISNAVSFTPMYSIDNYNWSQLPVSNFTISITDRATFQFAPLEAKWVKFIMTKNSFDSSDNGVYTYEFGVDEIAFYHEGFGEDATGTFISKPLSVTKTDKSVQKFSRLVLETCETLPSDTKIDYYITASNDSTVPLSSASWTLIDPLNRAVTTNPTLLDLGSLAQIEIDNLSICYNVLGATGFVNPAVTALTVSSISGTTPSYTTYITSAPRYSFANSNDVLLDLQLASSIEIAEGTLEIWRNVAKRTPRLVRGYQSGWGFSDPYYKTTVYVSNKNGKAIDFGSKPVIVDGVPVIGSTTIAYGRHSIWVHKDRWAYVDPSGCTTITDLKAVDSLYPYNHRALVEGITYPAGWVSTEAQVYTGFDIVAEYFMTQTSIFDFAHNMKADDYTRFAMDVDVADPAATVSAVRTLKPSQSVFLLKVDTSHGDFTNEKYILKFKSVDTLYTYLRLKAVLTTENESVTPLLGGYRIKMSS